MELATLSQLALELVVQVLAKLISVGRWFQTNAGLKGGTYGGGMARARTSVTSLIVGQASGFGLEHASPNISKRLTSSLLMLTLPIAN